MFVFQTLILEVQPKYQSALGLMEEKAVGVSDARQRAEQLQQEAKNLVTEAISKLQNLNGNHTHTHTVLCVQDMCKFIPFLSMFRIPLEITALTG